MSEIKRGIWEFASSGDQDDCGMYDGEVSVSAHPKGVLIEVTEEKAVDSYNEEFTCSCLVPIAKVSELIEFLIGFTTPKE